MNHAQKFIEQMKNDLDKNNSDLYENIVIRVDQKYAAMITVLGALLKFPTSTAFTDVLPRHLFDMTVSMDEEKYNKIIEDATSYMNRQKPNELPTLSSTEGNTIDKIIRDAWSEKNAEMFKFKGIL